MTLVAVDTAPLVDESPGPSSPGEAEHGVRGLIPVRLAMNPTWLSKGARYGLPLLVLAFLANLFLTQRRSFGDALDAVGGAQWVWLLALVGAGAGTYAMAALVLSAACRHQLPFRRTMAVQIASAFTNRLVPGGIGGMATNVRYLERCGLSRTEALSTVGTTWAAGVVAHLGVVVAVGLVFWFDGGDRYRANLPSADYWPIVGAFAAVSSGGGLLAQRFFGATVTRVSARVRSTISGLRHRPDDLARLLIGAAGMTACHTAALVIAIQAFGGGPSIAGIAIVYLAATAFAAFVPIPGGVGPIETALAAGLVGLGTTGGAAIAAVLTYRLATFWLPIVPGVLAFRSLRRRRIL